MSRAPGKYVAGTMAPAGATLDRPAIGYKIFGPKYTDGTRFTRISEGELGECRTVSLSLSHTHTHARARAPTRTHTHTHIVVLRVMTPCSLVCGYPHFRGTHCHYFRVEVNKVVKVAGYVEVRRRGTSHGCKSVCVTSGLGVT
jgi:hypothetical protein